MRWLLFYPWLYQNMPNSLSLPFSSFFQGSRLSSKWEFVQVCRKLTIFFGRCDIMQILFRVMYHYQKIFLFTDLRNCKSFWIIFKISWLSFETSIFRAFIEKRKLTNWLYFQQITTESSLFTTTLTHITLRAPFTPLRLIYLPKSHHFPYPLPGKKKKGKNRENQSPFFSK